MKTIFTIGHSNRKLEDFLRLLEEHGVKQLADVRRYPASRIHPHFGREALERSLTSRGIAYRHFEALGGRRPARPDSPHWAWETPGFRGYADHMDTEVFRQALEELEAWADAAPTAVLCAEALPQRCHRRLLSDALLARGREVIHILGPGRSEVHRLTPFARIEGGRIVYDGGTLPL